MTAKRDDIRKRNGTITVNESRSEMGLPLLDTPEADMPMLIAGQSVYIFTPDGMVAAGTPIEENGSAQEPVEPTAAQDEVKKFIRFVRKNPNRSFNFEHLEKSYADVLNKFIEAQDTDGARWYAERYLGQ